jgi:hypothetical protein
LSWNCNAHTSISSFVSGSGKEAVWLERGVTSTGTKTLQGAIQLIFARGFQGWNGPGRNNIELHQSTRMSLESTGGLKTERTVGSMKTATLRLWFPYARPEHRAPQH